MRGAVIMRHLTRITCAFAVAVLVLAPGSARADESDQSMIFTFSGPVAVPGVVLPAGTYQFKLAIPDSDRQLLEILSEDGSRVYATLATIPSDRQTPTDKAVVTFKEGAAGSPEAIRTVFYPGETTGMELVYPDASK
jgi:hypothetical protein